MPIEHAVQSRAISRNEFYSLDYEIMGLVFSVHRELGRFWNEKIYQNELAHRCQKAGVKNVATEVPIKVSYKDFKKFYYIDLLINDVIYELKTTQALTGEHQKQAINYLLLTDMKCGKLVNMRPRSVQHRFVSTKITSKKRYTFMVDDEHWRELDEESIWLKQIFKKLLNEWGIFLDVNLFYDAIIHFRGGEEAVIKEIEVTNGHYILGKQKTHLLNSNVAFTISSVTKEQKYFEDHLQRMIQYTSLKAMHWINFNYNQVIFKTILK